MLTNARLENPISDAFYGCGQLSDKCNTTLQLAARVLQRLKMPSIPLHPPSKERASGANASLPQVLRTPTGLAILEIQGTVNTPQPAGSALSASAPIGKLVFPHYDASNSADDTSWHKRVYLYVGKHQRLTGEVKKLANPIAVIRRRGTSSDSPDELEIAEIVYYKLLFAHRPEPVGGGVE